MIPSALQRLGFLLLVTLGGCTLMSNSPERAKAAVIASFGDDARIAGPMTPAQLESLAMLSEADAERVRALAREGAWIFSLLVPDPKPPRYAADGTLVELIKPGPILAVRQGRVIAEFAPVD